MLVVGDGSHVAIAQTIQSGVDNFLVITSNRTPGRGSNVILFGLRNGATTAGVAADLRDEFSRTPATAARGTRELVRDIDAFGLADIVHRGPGVFVTANLLPGRYYLTDLGNFTGSGSPAFTPLTVTPGGKRGPLNGGTVGVTATSADRFTAPSHWAASGTYIFANKDPNSVHFMVIQPVKTGTTDAQVQAYYDSHSQAPPPYARNGESIGNEIVSPGNTIRVNYGLIPGTYVLVCLVPDPSTGVPHAAMGMHKVITVP